MQRRRLRPFLALSVLAAALSLAAGLRAQSAAPDRGVGPASIRDPTRLPMCFTRRAG